MTDQPHETAMSDDDLWIQVRDARPATPAGRDSAYTPTAQALLASITADDTGSGSSRPRRRAAHRRPHRIAGFALAFGAAGLALCVGLAIVLFAGHGTHRTQRVASPGHGRLVAVAPDPQGGRPWGVSETRDAKGQTCLSVGREEGGRVGALGTLGAWGDDGAFHPAGSGRGVGIEITCGPTDAAGNGFVNGLDDNLVENGAGEATHAESGTGPVYCPASGLSGRREPESSELCPVGRLREIAYGLLGPDAVSVTYTGADGSSVTEPAGPGGAYLIVLPYRHSLCLISAAGCTPTLSTEGAKLSAGVVTTVSYRGGRVCRLPAPAANGELRQTSCPLVGYQAGRVPHATAQNAAAPVTATLSSSNLCERSSADRAFCLKHMRPATLHITFTARLPVLSKTNAYEAVLDLPKAGDCPGWADPIDPDSAPVKAGHQIHWTHDVLGVPAACAGHPIKITVAYVANLKLGLNGLGTLPFPSPGKGAVVVGRTTVTAR